MTMTRRTFIGAAIGATVVAAAGPLPIVPDIPTLWGDGIHDDTAGLQAAIDGREYRQAWDGVIVPAREPDPLLVFPRGDYAVAGTILIPAWAAIVDGNAVRLRGLGDDRGALIEMQGFSFSLRNFEFWTNQRGCAIRLGLPEGNEGRIGVSADG